MSWHSHKLLQPDWSPEARTLGLWYVARDYPPDEADDDIYLAINGSHKEITFELPQLHDNKQWLRFVDTGQANDPVRPPGRELPLQVGDRYTLRERSIVVLISRQARGK
ncbi:MAG TPA: hypothetical protein ENJ15_04835 [Caldithrix abyssi]|uniref:Isoamylase C-terminal domain-containing protein n=1 Tax=Caldithrix abyssi TaxID=187145 RepID=A0A7V5VER6_CALAY|nr:hypothetical protein [Caldithrix abyssi]